MNNKTDTVSFRVPTESKLKSKSMNDNERSFLLKKLKEVYIEISNGNSVDLSKDIILLERKLSILSMQFDSITKTILSKEEELNKLYSLKEDVGKEMGEILDAIDKTTKEISERNANLTKIVMEIFQIYLKNGGNILEMQEHLEQYSTMFHTNEVVSYMREYIQISVNKKIQISDGETITLNDTVTKELLDICDGLYVSQIW